jgi:hypothetical protein
MGFRLGAQRRLSFYDPPNFGQIRRIVRAGLQEVDEMLA